MSFPLIGLCLFLLAGVALLTFDVLVVLLTYSIYWYEYANHKPSAFDQRFSRRNWSLSLGLILPEICFNFITLSMFPFGLIKAGNQHLTRGKTPVILLHGLFTNQSCWFYFKRRLKNLGVENIVTLNLSGWHREEVQTELLAKRVDELRHRLGVNKVSLVGHSMGGIIARNYIQLRGGDTKIDRCICLGSPHHGSRLAPFSFSPLGKHLIPGSEFLQRLNSAPVPEQILMTNICSDRDNMVLPNNCCHLSWGTSVELTGMGHTSLIYRREPLEATAEALKASRQP